MKDMNALHEESVADKDVLMFNENRREMAEIYLRRYLLSVTLEEEDQEVLARAVDVLVSLQPSRTSNNS